MSPRSPSIGRRCSGTHTLGSEYSRGARECRRCCASPKLRLRQWRGERRFERVPGRIGRPLCDDVVDAWGDYVVVAHHRGDAAPLADLRVVAIARDAAIIEIGEI